MKIMKKHQKYLIRKEKMPNVIIIIKYNQLFLEINLLNNFKYPAK